MPYNTSQGTNRYRFGYRPVMRERWPYVDPVGGLVKSAIARSQDNDEDNSTFIKRKRNGDLQIVKVVNSRLRNTVVVTYPYSQLNKSTVVTADFKRYRHNTIDDFCQPCRETDRRTYDLSVPDQSFRFVSDVEEHMRICPENLKTVNEVLPLRMQGFDYIGDDALYAMEIYAFDVIQNDQDPLEAVIDLSLTNDRFTRDFAIKVKEIISFNQIEELVGKWVVFNFKGAFKIKSKEELKSSYRLLH